MFFITCLLCTTPEAFKVHDAVGQIDKVFASQCYYDAMERAGVSQADARTVANVEGNFGVKFYQADNKTVGYMNPGETTIWMNRKFHNSFGVCDTASNLAHELAHMAGFYHKADVAYSVNDAFSQCCVEPPQYP